MNRFRNDVAVLLAATVLILVGCDSKKTEVVTPPSVSGLAMAQTRLEQTPSTIDAVGTVHARESAALSSQVMGRVLSVDVREGDSVRAGQLLVVLDSAQAHSDVDRARAAVASSEQQIAVAQSEASLAASTLKRYQILRERKTVSPQEFDEVERRSQAADARLAVARAMMVEAKATETGASNIADYSHIRAPFAGTVTARHVDPGAMATPGMALLELEKTGTLQLNATVDESVVRSLQEGMTVPVEITALSVQPIAGKVAEIVPTADPGSHSFLVKIELARMVGLRSGMFGTATISRGRHDALTVAQSAIVSHGSLNGVWVLDGNKIASLRYVTLGEKRDDKVEVLSGLSAGESVVLAPGDRELGGVRIEVHQ